MRKEKNTIDPILSRYKKHPSNLIPILQEIQNFRSYLTKDDLTKISQKINIPLSIVYGVVTFYKNLNLKD